MKYRGSPLSTISLSTIPGIVRIQNSTKYRSDQTDFSHLIMRSKRKKPGGKIAYYSVIACSSPCWNFIRVVVMPINGLWLDTVQDFLIKLGIKPRLNILIGNKHFFTKSCNRQTYENYEQCLQKLGTYLENQVCTYFKNQSCQKFFFFKVDLIV